MFRTHLKLDSKEANAILDHVFALVFPSSLFSLYGLFLPWCFVDSRTRRYFCTNYKICDRCKTARALACLFIFWFFAHYFFGFSPIDCEHLDFFVVPYIFLLCSAHICNDITTPYSPLCLCQLVTSYTYNDIFWLFNLHCASQYGYAVPSSFYV